VSGEAPGFHAWMSGLHERVRVSSDVPPGVVMIAADPYTVARTISGGRAALGTEESREDYRSFAESFPYLIRVYEKGETIACECCGTPVALITESPAADPDASWKPGIWEPETLRRHTLRRCEWKRANR